VLDVVQNLQAAGVDEIGLLTEQIQERNPRQQQPPPAASGGQ